MKKINFHYYEESSINRFGYDEYESLTIFVYMFFSGKVEILKVKIMKTEENLKLVKKCKQRNSKGEMEPTIIDFENVVISSYFEQYNDRKEEVSYCWADKIIIKEL